MMFSLKARWEQKKAIQEATDLAKRHGLQGSDQQQFVSKYLTENGFDKNWLNHPPEPYIQLHVKGCAIEPQICFDSSRIILPKAPLGFPSWTSFNVVNRGFDLLQLKYEIGKSKQGLVRLLFPEGDTLSLAKENLPVIAVVESPRPISLEIPVTFVDDIRQKYTVTLVATMDNCLLTNMPFIDAHRKDLVVESREERPLRLCFSSQSTVSGLPQLLRGNSLTDFRTVLPRIRNAEVMNARRKKFLITFLNKVMLKTGIQYFPQDLVSQHGRPLWEAVEAFSGRPLYDRISGKLPSSPVGRMHALKKQAESGISVVQSLGGLLHDCRPEYLLSYSDYVTWYSEEAASGPGTDMLSQEEFDELSYVTWAELVLQTVRTLVLPRVSKMGSAGSPVGDTQKNKRKGGSKPSQSNFLSDFECSLLNWISQHYAKDRKLKDTCLTDFAKDMSDGTVLTAVLRDHLPRTYAKNSPLQNVTFEPVSGEDAIKNVDYLIQTLEELHLSPPFTREDFLDLASAGEEGTQHYAFYSQWKEKSRNDSLQQHLVGPGDQLRGMMICLWMLLYVPKVVSRSTVKISCPLGHSATKAIDVVNTSKSPVTYNVMLDGAEEFSLGSQKIYVDANSKYQLNVSCAPHSSKALAARLSLVIPHSTILSQGMIVFDLVCEVTSRPPLTTYPVSTPCYKPTLVEVEVNNLFDSTASFEAKIIHMLPDAKSGDNFVNALGESDIATFWTTVKRLDMKPHSRRIIPVQFLPMNLGTYKAALVLTDPHCGELVYEIEGESVLPKPLDFIQSNTSHTSGNNMEFSLWIPSNNSDFNTAFDKIQERTKDSSAQAALLRVREEMRRSLEWQCETDSPYFEVPKTFTLKEDDGDVSPRASAQLLTAKQLERSGSKPGNCLPIRLKTSKAGTYASSLLLHCPNDVRVYQFRITVMAPEVQRELSFECDVGESVHQTLPVENPTSSPWALTSHTQVMSSKIFSPKDSLPEEVSRLIEKHAAENTRLKKEISDTVAPASHSFSVDNDISVPANSTQHVTVKYCPRWIGSESVKLTLRGGPQDIEIQLSGFAREVAVSDTLRFTCQVYEQKRVDLNIPDPNPDSLFKIVMSDLECIEVDELVETGKRTSNVALSAKIVAKKSGHCCGRVYVYDAHTARYQFISVELNIQPGNPKESYDLSTKALSSETLSIPLSNDEDEDVTFSVQTEGPFLFCQETVVVPAKRTVTLPVRFTPLLTGYWPAAVTLYNDRVGEQWYELRLTSSRPVPVELPRFDIPVGETQTHSFVLSNPSPNYVGFEAVMDESIQRNYEVNPKQISLPPNGESKITVRYRPSDIEKVDEGSVSFTSDEISPLEYHLVGKGLPPKPKEERVRVNAEAGGSSSGTIEFMNPFAVPKQVQITIREVEGPEGSEAPKRVFELLRPSKALLDPFSTLQIPFAFAPVSIGKYTSTIAISVGESGELWRFRVDGVGEAPLSDQHLSFRGKARTIEPLKKTVKLEGLYQLEPEDEFYVELFAQNEDDGVWLNNVLNLSVSDTFIKDKEVFVKIEGSFAPLKPKKCNAQVAVTKTNGGTWRFPSKFYVDPADPDDEIHLEAMLHETSTGLFVLENQMDHASRFSAQLDLNSSPELSVSPNRGVLPPAGAGGVEFSVSYSSREYGRISKGTLVIDTPEMQWRYAIIGTAPEYVKPEGHSQVHSRRETSSKK
eukprot:gb/GECG01010052.1/.p1 GENE.gb/GECG01010052.1/~~gb/GECG01010052.1/.p1  ORF type:complete len:1690 (+),score=184.73 gb/GECG01010052.1/:1-5070(+)